MLKMLNMVPGLRELLLLGKTWFTEQERTSDDKPLWDAIVIDGPATGHSISLFRLPRVILSLMKVGPMAKDAQEQRAAQEAVAREGAVSEGLVQLAILQSELPPRLFR